MKILILGGNRFIGKKVAVKLLSHGYNVTVVNRSGTGPEGATIIKHDRDGGFDKNFFGKKYDVILDFCLFKQSQALTTFEHMDLHQRYYFISSAAAYKDSNNFILSDYMPTGGLKAFGEYGVEKALCENVIRERCVNYTIFRPPYIVGKDCPRPRLRYYFDQILNNRDGVKVPGDGNSPFSIVWADDVVEILFKACICLDYYPNRQYNLTGSDVYSCKTLVNELAEFMNRPQVSFLYDQKDTPFLNEPLILNSSLIYEKFIPIKYRLKEFCEYYKINYE